MASSPEYQASKSRVQVEEYVSRFPEIPTEELEAIIQQNALNPELCLKMLETESKKYLYGSSPVRDPPSPLRILSGGQSRTEGTSLFDLPRCNSTGSAGSSHSSGRSTPVNIIPTPWVKPRFSTPTTSSGHGTPPVHYSTAGLPPGTVYINGNFYQPVISPYNLPGQPSVTANQVLPTETNPTQTGNQTNEGLPNIGYLLYNTNDGPPANTSAVASHQPIVTNSPGVPLLTQYFSPSKTMQGYSYYQPSENLPYSGQYDPRYHTLPGSFPPAAFSRVSTPNLPSNEGFTPLSTASTVNRVLHDPATINVDQQLISNTSANQGCSLLQINSSFQTNLDGNSATRQSVEPLFVLTSPDMNTPETLRRMNKSSPDDLKAFGAFGMSSKQAIGNDDYLRACVSRQYKRFQKLQKEYKIEKERLEIVIKDISERDGALYKMKYVIAPNPTDDQVLKLAKENEKLNREIDEISKNIDRLDRGDAFRPPIDPRIHDTQRLPSGGRHRETFDRSNSVPCINRDPGRAPAPPLSRPLSEHDMNHMIQLDKDRVQYQRNKPPLDTTLQEWNFINPSLPDPLVDETQWSCSRCTFLNHDSLTVCEMCNSSRRQ